MPRMKLDTFLVTIYSQNVFYSVQCGLLRTQPPVTTLRAVIIVIILEYLEGHFNAFTDFYNLCQKRLHQLRVEGL